MVTHSENTTLDQTDKLILVQIFLYLETMFFGSKLTYCQGYVQARNSGSISKFYVLEKIAQAQCLGSIHRLNIQAQYLIFLC